MKKIRNIAALTGLSALLAVQGCASSYNSNKESEKAQLESIYEREKEKLEQEKASLVALNESLSEELESEQKGKEALEEELHDIKEKYGIPGEKEYAKDDLILFAIPNNDQVEYRFVEHDESGTYKTEEYDCNYKIYRSITHVEKKYRLNSYYYKDSEMEYDNYERNTDKNYFVPSTISRITINNDSNIPFPKGYEDKKIYSYEDLVEIETIINSPDYEIQSSNQFNIYELSLVNLNSYYMFANRFFTEEYNLSTKNIRRVMYLVSITNPSVALKYLQNEETGYYAFYGFSCLNNNDQFYLWNMLGEDLSQIMWEETLQRIIVKDDVQEYFNVEPFEKISYDDIKAVETQLNNVDKRSLKQK